MPGLLEWPAKIQNARETSMPCVTSDYLPTILAITGLEMIEHPKPLDGVNLLPLIEGKMESRPRPIGFQTGNMATLSGNQYKLVLVGRGQNAKTELYDLLADPSETKNLAGEMPEITERMKRELKAWQKSCERSALGQDYK